MDYLQEFEEDIYLFNHGKSYKSYYILGAHPYEKGDIVGCRFAVWAPNADRIEVIGDFNRWKGENHFLTELGSTGVWIGFFENIKVGTPYKYKIFTGNTILYKSDPFGFSAEKRPLTASIIHGLNKFQWDDQLWINQRKEAAPYNQPINIYEVHLGSWKLEGEDFLDFYAITNELIPYVKEMGYTHIELLPIMEHPFDGSWGYQQTGYFALSGRYGALEGFKHFVNQCHLNNVGVFIDWVPGHFCKDAHGLHLFDGTWLYGVIDHPQWGTVNFDFSRKEVVSFLLSNAYYWLEQFHVDGLRVDGVTNMLYKDFDYQDASSLDCKFLDDNICNIHAVAFLRSLNEIIFRDFPGILMMAEESTTWPLVTSPTNHDGLGFNYKWDMGWMNDTLHYMETSPEFRKEEHHRITFSMHYAFSENFICSLSHDEVVHGKKSLINKMPGGYEEKFSNLRLLYCYMMFHPGKKLLFMGGEFAQFIEWRYGESLDWHLLDYPTHKAFHHFVKELNHLYISQPALWEIDHSWEGFQWIEVDDKERSCYTFLRKGLTDQLLICINFSKNQYKDYEMNLPDKYDIQLLFTTEKDLKDCQWEVISKIFIMEMNPLSCYCFQLTPLQTKDFSTIPKEVSKHDY
ncbi:1,4-alpha-glucan branching protein GlgB [Vallitalea okinawensis]|uniref:1,4-alpha-glucan branching protein GlgB n=1 Tax=Vallitalea okinawensis TaxID=2078660 RepID=UPI000CFDD2B6|nr:1,4-alpha-glucan branching protein GlgB [Vallitalea okinawensis]